MRMVVVFALTLGLTLGVAQAQPKHDAGSPAISDGAKVQLQYTLTVDDGKVLDSNKGGDPLAFTQGQHEIIPGLEKALDGMHAGEEKKVTLQAADAYGEVNPEAVAEVPKERIPPNALTVGTELVAQGPSGEQRTVRVKEIRDTTVIIDLNHPLAGKTLMFDIKVLNVEPPSK